MSTTDMPSPNLSEMRGQSVIVFGGGSGIGFAAAKIAAGLGASVLIAGRTMEKLEAAQREIPGSRIARADVTVETDIRNVLDGLDRIDHVFLSAGTSLFGNLIDIPRDQIEILVNERFWAPVVIAQTAARRMKSGSITFLTGGLGSRPVRGAALKHAVLCATEGLTRGLAVDIAPIRVNAVAPGYTRTPLFVSLLGDKPVEKMKRMAATIPVGRLGVAEDAAKAVIYLMTSGFVSGEIMHVDGGGRFVPPSLAFVDD